jgi:ankyrin repeat protein
MTALMRAAADGCVATVEALLAARADVNLRNRKGQTALTIAMRAGHTAIVRLLKRAGAND